MKVLVIDNHDSFTWNLVQLVGALGATPEVARNDRIALGEITTRAPDRIILSPGPGHPEDARRVGVCRDVIATVDLPILGVCLGHQAIVHAFGGSIVRTVPVHGKTSLVHHEGDGIFRGLPVPFEAMRYHSLVADPRSIPSTLAVTAWCKDGTVMGVRHRTRPVFGVQFHPESIGTGHGRTLIERFLSGDLS